jgi:hypothetical protein
VSLNRRATAIVIRHSLLIRVLVAAAAACVGMWIMLTTLLHPPCLVWSVVAVASGLALIVAGVRLARANITIDGDRLVGVGLLRTRSVSRGSIHEVVTRPFRGSFLITLRLHTGARFRLPWSAQGTRSEMEELLTQIAQWLDRTQP